MAVTLDALLRLKADVTGEGAINSLATGLGKVQTAAGQTVGGFGRLTQGASGLLSGLQGLAPALTGAGLVAMAKGAIDAADNMRDLSQKTGVSVEVLSQFKQAAEMSGTTLEKVGGALLKFNKGLADGKAAEALKELGISATDANGKLKPTDQLLLEVADKFKKMPDGAEKSALAMRLFGKSGAELIPMLNMGGEAIKALGVTMTTDFANKADNFNDKMVSLQTSIGQIGVAVGTLLLPFLEAAANGLLALTQAFQQLPAPVQQLIGGAAALAAGFVVLAPAINAIIALVGLIGPAFVGLGATIAGWAGVVVPLLTGVGATVAGWAGAIGPVLATVGGLFQGLLTVLAGVFTGPVGWVALLAAAAAALYVFREPIGEFITWIGETLWGWIESLWELGEPIRQFWLGLWESVKQIATQFFTWFGQVLWDWFVQPWIDIGTALYDAAVQLWETIKTPIAGFFAWWGEFLYKAYVEPWVKLGQFLIDAAVQTWTAIKNAVSGFFTWIAEVARTYLYDPIVNALQGIAQFFSDVWNTVKDFLVGWFSWWGEFLYKAFVEPVVKALEAVGKLFQAGWDAIAKTAAQLWDNVVQAWSDALDKIQAIWDKLAGWWESNVIKPIATAWGNLMDSLGSLVNKAVSAVGKAWNQIVTSFVDGVIRPIQQAWTQLANTLGNAMDGAISTLKQKWDQFANALRSAFQQISTFFYDNVARPLGDFWNGVTEKASSALNRLVSAVQGAYKSIAGAVQGAFKGILGTVGNIVNQIIDAINKLISGTNAIRTKLGLSELPIIPRVNWASFAEGGVVTKPTAAIVGEGGEPEYIVPASKMQAAALNYLSGLRGEAVINGKPNALAAAGKTASQGVTIGRGNSQVNITTGPVQQIGSGRFVTLEDLQNAVKATSQQVRDQLLRELSQPSVRQRLGWS